MHGKNGQVDRVRKAYSSIDAKPGPIYFLIKDHKAVKPGEVIPPTRPVCSAKGGPGSRFSNLLSTLINKTADSIGSETECMSTEEALQKILQTNREIKSKSEDDPAFRVCLFGSYSSHLSQRDMLATGCGGGWLS